MNRGRFIRLLSILGFPHLVFFYIDPGTFGLIAQIGYMLLFGALSALLFFFRPIKALFYRIMGREPESKTDTPKSDDDSEES
jgi:hypothetical protein